MINVFRVRKKFGTCEALHDVSFTIERGEIIGFLGENGAGKTTLMRLLTGYLEPTSGQITINGQTFRNSSRTLKRMIGYLPETPPLYHDMTVDGYLRFAARLKDISYTRIGDSVGRVMEVCQLDDVAGKIIGTLSKGYKQRVGIAQAIVHDPQILILDEPTSGLDPVQIIQVRKLIQDLEYTRTVILSTHILSEIEQMAKRVLIIKNGQKIADTLLSDLLKDHSPDRRRILGVRGDLLTVKRIVEEKKEVTLNNIQSIADVHYFDLTSTGTIEQYNGLLWQLMKENVDIVEIKDFHSNLEDVFLRMIAPLKREGL